MCSPQVPGHYQVFVNAPKFQDLKQVMSRNGIQAEFTGGVLVCNSVVAIKRVRNWFDFYSSFYRNLYLIFFNFIIYFFI